ncbi:hypothetical protein MJI20_30400, partial [Salmonella enterica subsp. enterica serovar Anatum]|nr:hypothetical protein [Salmonella enterica subsp. enterica serovar Anatum]
ADMFGVGAFNRPWQQPGEALELAKRKADVAFEFFHKLNVPFYSPVGYPVAKTSCEEMTMDYSQLSDFEINKRVFKAIVGAKPLG